MTQAFHSNLTIKIRAQPSMTDDGTYLTPQSTSYNIRGIFIPEVGKTLRTGLRGDELVSTSEVQLEKWRLGDLSLPGVEPYNTQITYNGRNYTVIQVDDYTEKNGCYLLKLVAEVDVDAY